MLLLLWFIFKCFLRFVKLFLNVSLLFVDCGFLFLIWYFWEENDGLDWFFLVRGGGGFFLILVYLIRGDGILIFRGVCWVFDGNVFL